MRMRRCSGVIGDLTEIEECKNDKNPEGMVGTHYHLVLIQLSPVCSQRLRGSIPAFRTGWFSSSSSLKIFFSTLDSLNKLYTSGFLSDNILNVVNGGEQFRGWMTRVVGCGAILWL